MGTISIQYGLPDNLRAQAAQIYAEAFRQKLNPLFGAETVSAAVLQDSFDPDMGIVALEEDQLVGVVGIQHGGRHFINFQREQYIRRFGWLAGLIKYLLFSQGYARPQRSGELLMDGIAVAANQRGKGVGSRLLQAVFDYAARHDFRAVRLDVIDTNPKARRLYERMGFVPTDTHHYPFLKFILGFSSATTMIKTLAL